MGTYTIGERVHRLPRIAQCRVCRSHLRAQVEAGLVDGVSYRAIVDGLPDGTLSARNVGEHFKRGHLPVEDEVHSRLRKDRSRQAGQLIQRGVERKIDELSLAHAVVERAADRLASGELEPTMREAIAAARLLERYDRVRSERDDLRRGRDDAQRALSGILSLAKPLMAVESWSRLGRQVEEDAVLRAFWPSPT